MYNCQGCDRSFNEKKQFSRHKGQCPGREQARKVHLESFRQGLLGGEGDPVPTGLKRPLSPLSKVETEVCSEDL